MNLFVSEPSRFSAFISRRSLILLIVTLAMAAQFAAQSVMAQEGIIAASYYEEKTMLRKMWDARKAGDEAKVKALSVELKGFVDAKKSWATDFLTLTRNSIAELQKAQNPDLTDEQRAEKEQAIRELNAQIRLLEQQLEEARLLYFQSNYLDRLEIRKEEKLIPLIREAGKKRIAEHEKLIAENRPIIEQIKARGTQIIAEKQLYIEERKKLFALIESEAASFLKAENELIAARQLIIPKVSEEGQKALADIDNSLKELKGRKSVEGLQREISDNQARKAEITRQIAAKDFSSPALNWVTQGALEREISEHQKKIADTQKAIAEGLFSTAAVNWQNKQGVQGDIDGVLKEIAGIKEGMGNGTYGVPEYNWRTESGILAEINAWQKVIAETNGQLSSKTFSCPELNWRNEGSVEQKIAQLQDELKRRKEEFTSESFWNMGGIRRQIEDLRLQVMTLEEEAGLRDDKIKALQSREQELKKYLAHDFLTALPEEESAFMKAIHWCSNAIKEVNSAAEKFKKLKQVVEIIKTASNPAQAADQLLKATTGRGFFEFVGEKMLPEKVYKNPLVQSILKGGKIDHKELVEKFAADNLPPELIETIKTFEAMKNDPQAFVRSKMYDEVMTVVEGNPKLKQTYQSFKEAQQFIKNPELIEKKLEESLKNYSEQLVKDAKDQVTQSIMADEHAQKLKAHLESYRARLEKIKTESEERIDQFTENVAAGITRNLQNSLEETVGLKETITPFVQELVEGYSFTD